MDYGLTGKVALVTGAGSQIGFGRAIALALAREGCAVVVNDVDRDGAAKTGSQVEALGREARVIAADVTRADEWVRMVDEIVTHFGKIDILVNNAGGCTPPKPFLEMSDADWEFDIDINLTSVKNGTRAVLPHMIRQGWGRIINITSGAGIHGGMFTAGYAAAKAGVIAFSKAIAKEVARHGVIVNCVSPGPANTGFARNAPPGLLENVPKTLAVGRLTTPEDVAIAVAFLASEVAGDIVGQVLVVSGDVNP